MSLSAQAAYPERMKGEESIVTRLLEKAIKEVSKLPEDEQDVCAAIILQELASEERWTETFAVSQDELARLADEALSEYRRGDAKPLGFDDR